MRKLDSIRLKDIKISDGFWNRYIDLVREKMLPYQWEALNDRIADAAPSHCIENFRIAAGISRGEYYGQVFQDSDVAKWIEAVSYNLETHENAQLETAVDSVVDIFEKAQDEDGYMNTYYTIKEPAGRWSNLREGHELYVAGHMIEAGAAYYQATGKKKFLHICCKMADCICRVFGEDEGKIHGCPGHPEIELALVKLYRLTKKKEYLNMAKYFLDIRGNQSPDHFDEEQKAEGFHHIFPEFEHLGYNNISAHKPVRRQNKADGHAVRALYLYSAMADVGYECGDDGLLAACRNLFDNIVNCQMFITGSVGAAADGECFTCDYDLPNNYNYSETCASVALAMFAYRMFQIERDGRYMDVVERALYNTILGGMSLTGTEFFYVNPLEVIPNQLRANRTLHHVLLHRRRWLGVACCPPNIARTLTGLGNYIYSVDEETIYVNLYIAGEMVARVNGAEVRCRMETHYPYEGEVRIEVECEETVNMGVAFREPDWAVIDEIRCNECEKIHFERRKGYLYISPRRWGACFTLNFTIPLRAQLIAANPSVVADVGKAAIMRGPIVYCLEEVDNGAELGSIYLDPEEEMHIGDEVDGLEGVCTILAKAYRLSHEEWEGELYQPWRKRYKPMDIKAVPYCMWNNRGEGEMRVWMHVL